MTKLFLSIAAGLAMASLPAAAQTGTNKLLDLCEKNTSSSYKTYNTATGIKPADTLTVRTARYTDFYPALTGKGTLIMYCGGERTYLGTHDNKTWPDWSRFSGDVHIYPYKAVEGGAGFYGLIMPTRGKSYSPEDANPAGKIAEALANSKTTLHKGAALATEKSAAGVRIGELNTEEGSRMYGYFKTNTTTTAYYLLGGLDTDATLAGRIASMEKNGAPDTNQPVGIVKEGKGTYTITGNDNVISGGVRVNEGTLLVCNDVAKAKSKKLTGATGSAANASMPVAYVFVGAAMGGTGNVGGNVDLYGMLVPGVDGAGTLHIENYATSAACNVTLHPASVISCSIASPERYSSLSVSGKLIGSTMTQSFTESDKPAEVRVSLAEGAEVSVGDTFTLIQARKGRGDADSWSLKVVTPDTLTWSVSEQTDESGAYMLTLTCTSLENGGEGDTPGGEDTPGGGENPDDEEDNVSDENVPAGKYLRQYLEMTDNGKRIGVAVPSWWKYDVPNNPNSVIGKAISNNFNLCVAENEMKMDVVEPQQNVFDYDRARQLVNYAKSKKMAVRGHTLVWHKQCPAWISSDGKKNDKNWTREQLLKIMENHITKVVKAFDNDVCEWDVVNETLDDDQSIVRSQPTKYQLLKESVWVKVIGEDFIDSAFVYAHRANPNVKLYLNDYDSEFTGVAKTTALFNLAKRLKDSGIPIDGVGLQCHLKPSEVDKAALDATVKRYASIGLNCIFTEIDLAIDSPTEANLQAQAKAFKDIAEVFVKNDNCPHMVVWGINDQHTWIADRHPLLFDANTKAKPAYYSVQAALRHYVATGIADVFDDSPSNAEVRAKRYFSFDGKPMATPQGTFVEQIIYTDGTTRAHVVRR